MKTTGHVYPKSDFGSALRIARSALGRSQEDFDVVSSRTYISSLERGLKVPTVNKVDSLASVLDIHPLTLLALSYLNKRGGAGADLDELLTKVFTEAAEIIDVDQSR